MQICYFLLNFRVLNIYESKISTKFLGIKDIAHLIPKSNNNMIKES
jgi:hypothetical protein